MPNNITLTRIFYCCCSSVEQPRTHGKNEGKRCRWVGKAERGGWCNMKNLKGMRIAQGAGNVSVQLKKLLLQTAAAAL